MSHALTYLSRHHSIKVTGAIHVGANRGQEVAAFKEEGIAAAVFVEPLPASYRRLCKVIRGIDNFYAVQECLSHKAGETVTFHVASNGGQASSFLEPQKHLELYPNVQFNDHIEFVTSTLDDVMQNICAESGLSLSQFEYLGLDTQGTELQVLQGGRRVLSEVKYVYTEVNFGGLYKGDVDLYQMTDFMRSLGFDLYYLLMRARQWGDAFYMRRK